MGKCPTGMRWVNISNVRIWNFASQCLIWRSFQNFLSPHPSVQHDYTDEVMPLEGRLWRNSCLAHSMFFDAMLCLLYDNYHSSMFSNFYEQSFHMISSSTKMFWTSTRRSIVARETEKKTNVTKIYIEMFFVCSVSVTQKQVTSSQVCNGRWGIFLILPCLSF